MRISKCSYIICENEHNFSIRRIWEETTDEIDEELLKSVDKLPENMEEVSIAKENIETIVPVEKVVESSERIDSHHDTVTKVYMNLSEPDQIERYAELPFEGIHSTSVQSVFLD